MKKFVHYIRSIFALDTRSLAVLRIVIGLVLIRDLVIGLQFLTAFHTDSGILPLDILMTNYPSENVWSIHAISNTYTYQLVLFILHCIIAVAFTLGYKTHIATILLWVFTLSLHWHNPLILNWWDTVVRLILFWGMFLPLGHQRSLDRRNTKKKAMSVFSLATVGYILQVCFVYIFATILKDHPRWTQEFSAVYYALSLDPFVTTLWSRVYQYPTLMERLTKFSYYLEWFGLVLLLIPRKNHLRRILCIGLFISFHLWLGLTMQLYSFPYIMIGLRLALVPAAGWQILSTLQGGHTDTDKDTTPIPNIIIQTQKLHPLISVFLILSLGYIFSRNLRTTDFDRHNDWFSTDINRFWFLFRIDQYRNMFAPYPFVDDGRVILEGIHQDGTSINLLDPDAEYSLAKPADMKRYYPHERRRKYYTSMWMKKNSDYRQYGAAYHCNARNKAHPDNPLTQIKRYYVLERTLADFETEEIDEVLLYDGECG